MTMIVKSLRTHVRHAMCVYTYTDTDKTRTMNIYTVVVIIVVCCVRREAVKRAHAHQLTIAVFDVARAHGI